jgi:hypothetical protein
MVDPTQYLAIDPIEPPNAIKKYFCNVRFSLMD